MSRTSVSLSKKLADTLAEAVANLEQVNNDIDNDGWKQLQAEEEEVNALEQELEELEQARKEKAKVATLERRAEKARLLAESGHEDDVLVSNEAMQELEEAKTQLDLDRLNLENDKFQMEVLQAQLGGKDSVSVEDKSYMIAARELDIRCAQLGGIEWISVPETRYAVAEMLETNFFQIYGRVAPSSLFPYTKYGAYFIYKFTKDSYGYDFSFGEGGAGIGGEDNEISIYNIYLVSKEDQAGGEDARVYPMTRADGWMEVELGTFLVKGDEDGEIQLSMIEIWSGVMRKGLVVLGMELRALQVQDEKQFELVYEGEGRKMRA